MRVETICVSGTPAEPVVKLGDVRAASPEPILSPYIEAEDDLPSSSFGWIFPAPATLAVVGWFGGMGWLLRGSLSASMARLIVRNAPIMAAVHQGRPAAQAPSTLAGARAAAGGSLPR